MSYLNPLNIQKPQDIHLSDEERHIQFKNAGLEENYSSMTGLIYNGNNVRTEVAGKVNIKELYNEIDGQIHQLEGYNQDGVNDVLDEYDEEYQDTISNISDKGAYDPTVAYHFGNVVDYSTLNSKITPKYTNKQNTTTGKNLFNVNDSSFQWGTLYFNLVNNVINISIGDGNGGIGQNSQGDYTNYNFDTSKEYYFSIYPKNGQLTFKEDAVSKWLKVCLYIKYSDDTTSPSDVLIRPNMSDRQSVKLTFTEGKTPVAFAIGRYSPGSTLNNNQTAEYYVQLEENAATSYEPYTGGLPSPSPEYQQKITAIKAVNLFDKDYFLTHISDFTAFYQNYFYGIELGNEFKTVINASTFLKGTTQSNYVLGLVDDVRKPENIDRFLNTNGEIGNKVYDFTNSEHVYFVFGRSTQMSTEAVRLEVLQTILNNYDVQIEEGDTPHTYAPYGKIPIRCYTNNLAVNSEYILDTEQTSSISWGKCSNDYINVKYGDTYTLSFYYNDVLNYSSTYGYAYIYAYNSNKEKIGTDYMSTSNLSITTKTILDPNIMYLKVQMGVRGHKGDNFKLQLEEGSTRTEYKPYYNKYFYLDLQGNELSKIIAGTGGSPKTIEDDITIDENNNIIFNKNVGKCVLVGTENVGYDSSMDRFTTPITNSVTEAARNKVLCDRFCYVASGNNTDGGCFIYNKLAYFYNRSCASSQDFKTWLTTHNTTLYYEFQTPQQISLGTLPADFLPHIGNVNIEVCTNLEATNKYNIGTNSYLTLQDTTAGTLPTNTTYFKNIGLTGDIGDSSIGTVTCGVWDSTTTYNEKDLVAYGTDLYVAKQANTNQTPSSASQYWELIIQYDKPLVALSNYAPDNIIKGSLWFDII